MLLSAATYLILYSLRYLDDNRLTSWQDAFGFVRMSTGLLCLIPAIVAASLLARTSIPDRNPVAFLLVISFLSVVPFWSEPELIVDASRYFTAAKNLEIYGAGYFLKEWGRNIAAWTDLPVVPFLYGLIFRVFGETRIYIQIFTTLLFSCTVLLTYATGKALWDEKVGMAGGMLLLGIPYLFSQIPLMLVDVPSMFFLMLSFYLLIKALEGGGYMIPLAAFAIFLTFYVKYSTWLMLTVLGAVSLVYLFAPPPVAMPRRMEGKRAVGGRKKLFLRVCMVGFLSVVMTGALFLYKKTLFLNQLNFLINYQEPGLRRWGESFVSTFFFQIHPLISLSALFSVYAAVRERDPKYLAIIWLVLIVFVFRIRRIRYIIMVFPLLSLAASYGLARFRTWETVKLISLGIAAFSLVVAIFVYRPFLDRISMVNLQSAGVLLDATGSGPVEVVTIQPSHPVANIAVAVPLLDLFTHRRILYQGDSKVPEDAGDISTSPLRFTWEYRNPRYYSSSSAGDTATAFAVISGEREPVLSPEMEAKTAKLQKKIFDVSTGIFAFRTYVTTYY